MSTKSERKWLGVWVAISVDGPEAKKNSPYRWRMFVGESDEKIPLKGIAPTFGMHQWEDNYPANFRDLIGWIKVYGNCMIDEKHILHIDILPAP